LAPRRVCPDDIGNGLRHQARIGERRQIGEPDAVLVGALQADRESKCEPSLANAAWSDQRQEPSAGVEVIQASEIAIATDEAAQLSR
jgi:hypothetical protein